MFRFLASLFSTPGPDAIVAAAEKHDTRTIRALLDSKADVNVKRVNPYDDAGDTALAKACAQPDTGKLQSCVDVLLAAKANPNTGNRMGTPLSLAVEQGNLPLVSKLLENGAGIDLPDNNFFRNTPLHIAAREGHEAIVRVLLEHKANHTVKNCDGETALQRATDDNNIEVIKVMNDFFKPAESKQTLVEPPTNQTITPSKKLRQHK